MKGRWALKAARMLGFLVVGSLAIGLVVMLLWNALIPELFNGPVLTFWQSVGLLILSHVLLRGWGHRGHGWHHDRWRHRFEEKLAAMTPEERDKFKGEWRRRCGWTTEKSDVKTSS
jgi:hypothetical protein